MANVIVRQIRTPNRVGSRLKICGLAIAVALALGGCAQVGSDLNLAMARDGLGAGETRQAAEPDDKEIQSGLTYWATAFAKNPGNEKAAIAYAENLRYLGKDRKAYSVLQRAAMANSSSRPIASAYGRLALRLGKTRLARKLLVRADDPAHPDWRTVSALGTALARLDDPRGAQKAFERALKLKPEHPSLMNNLALAKALDGRADEAEALLRRAAAKDGDSRRIRQNLALVLGLQGKTLETRKIAAAGSSTPTAPSPAAAALPRPQKLAALAPASAPAAPTLLRPAALDQSWLRGTTEPARDVPWFTRVLDVAEGDLGVVRQ